MELVTGKVEREALAAIGDVAGQAAKRNSHFAEQQYGDAGCDQQAANQDAED